MRSDLAVTLGLSLAFHGAVAAYVLVGPKPSEEPEGPTPLMAGETFELPAPETEAPLANAAAESETVTAEPPDEADAPVTPAPPGRGAHTVKPSRRGRPSGGRPRGAADSSASGTGSEALYGAVGDRSAADLATAFTRAFPQAASGDPVWRGVAFGAAGEATVTLSLDEAGRIVDSRVGGHASPALAAGVKRTLVLIRGRPFTARGKTTTLHITANVTADTVHDGLHGDVFAIGGSFAGGQGSAFFALAIGRRIDVRVRIR